MSVTTHIGFTGTRKAPTMTQRLRLVELFATLDEGPGVRTLHHGDCVGADATAVASAGQFMILTCCHPPTNPLMRAWTDNTWTETPRDYLVRNADIVRVADLVIAMPDGPERLRSGTWWTVRAAIAALTPVIIITPDGRFDCRPPEVK